MCVGGMGGESVSGGCCVVSVWCVVCVCVCM